MAWLANYPRKYYEKYKRVNVKNDFGWYQVYQLDGNVYGICEPQHFQEVNIFLIIGEKRSLLLDSGMGIYPLKPLISELYNGEVIQVNSHFHFDHIGSNYQFQPTYLYNDSYAKAISEKGLSLEGVGDQMTEEMFQFGYPENFTSDKYEVKPYSIIPMEDGHIFDLGNRILKVIHTPGHSNDSIMLYDEGNKILFTGDTFYLGALYTHFNCAEFGKGNVDTYMNTMEYLSANIPEDVKLYCSHNDFVSQASKFKEVLDGLKSIKNNNSLRDRDVNNGHVYLESQEKISEYPCDGFSIVYKVIEK